MHMQPIPVDTHMPSSLEGRPALPLYIHLTPHLGPGTGQLSLYLSYLETTHSANIGTARPACTTLLLPLGWTEVPPAEGCMVTHSHLADVIKTLPSYQWRSQRRLLAD